MKTPHYYLLCLSLLLLAPLPAHAQNSGLLGEFGDWSAFAVKQNGKPVCYIGSQPTKSKGKYTRRGDIFFLVTHRPAIRSTDVVNVQAGYTYKKGTSAAVTIDKKTFSLFTDNSDAWASATKTDKALVKAMIRGSKMIIKGTSSRGTVTTDTFSLTGFTAAYKAASKACKI